MKDIPDNLDIAGVNFNNPDDITGFALLLGRQANLAGMFIPGGGNQPLVSKVRTAAREWIRLTDTAVHTLTPSGAFSVMSAYDIVHRIAYGKPPFPDVINRHVLRAFDAMIRGDKTIDRYAMFRHISAALSHKDKAYLGKPLQWYSITLDRWHTMFRHGSPTTRLSACDTLEIVSLLLESDLWLFETHNQAAYKQRLFDKTRPLLNQLNDILKTPTPKNLPTFKALHHLLTASAPYLTPDDYEAYSSALSLTLPTSLSTLHNAS